MISCNSSLTPSRSHERGNHHIPKSISICTGTTEEIGTSEFFLQGFLQNISLALPACLSQHNQMKIIRN